MQSGTSKSMVWVIGRAWILHEPHDAFYISSPGSNLLLAATFPKVSGLENHYTCNILTKLTEAAIFTEKKSSWIWEVKSPFIVNNVYWCSVYIIRNLPVWINQGYLFSIITDINCLTLNSKTFWQLLELLRIG